MKIEVSEILEDFIKPVSVKKQWQKDVGYSRFIGDSFLTTKKICLLKFLLPLLQKNTL